MTNAYYTPTGTPSFNARAASATARNESSLVEAAFDKLAAPDVIGSSAQNYAVDTGNPSAMVVAINGNVTAPFDGMEIVVKALYAATGPSTIVAGNLAVSPVLRMDGAPISANDWLGGQIFSLRYDANRNAYQYTPPYTGVAQVVVPLSDAAPIVKNAVDPTKQLRVDVSQIATATTRVATMPDRNIVLGKEAKRVVRTSNIALGEPDIGGFFDVTSGTFTQTFAAPSVLRDGWVTWYRNSGSGDIEVAAPASVSTTSVTSNSIAAGTTWTVATGLAISPGHQMIVRRTSDAFNQRIAGTVASYNSGTGVLVMTVQGRIGSGTFTDWAITTGAASIDGLPSYVMYPGESRAFYCDGVNITSVVISAFLKTFTAGGSFVKPPGYRQFGGLLWGGGGSGAKGANYGGAGGGNCTPFQILASVLAVVSAVVIGAGGAAVSASGSGVVGGTSSFGSIASYGGGFGSSSSGGGGGGPLSAANSSQGGAPVALGGDGATIYTGQFGGAQGATAGSPVAGSSFYGGAGGATNGTGTGGNSVYGGAGGGTNNGTSGTAGGTSQLGGSGGAGAAATNGGDGVAPGGGGGSTATGALSGAGARGELRVWGIA